MSLLLVNKTNILLFRAWRTTYSEVSPVEVAGAVTVAFSMPTCSHKHDTHSVHH